MRLLSSGKLHNPTTLMLLQSRISWEELESSGQANHRQRKGNEMDAMTDYQKRVVQELAELNEKREKLSDFIGTLTFIELNQFQKELLNKQSVIMELYAETLQARIMSFT
jgi:predicted nuclease with TOPRIM domain